jgi:hypothetical protein
MSVTASVDEPPSQAPPFEQSLFERSPLGTFSTVVALFAVMFGSFIVVALIWQIPFVAPTVQGTTTTAGWPAMVLSLLCCTALAAQRYVRLWEARELPAYAKILSGGLASAKQITRAVPRDLKLWPATLIGVTAGLILSAVVWASEVGEGHRMPLGAVIWFTAATTFLTVLFTRGIAQTQAGSTGYRQALNDQLKVDLLRTDALAVVGRSAARVALIWFVTSAVACLFFVGGDLNWLTVLLIAACVATGVIVFVSIMGPVHRRIVAIKTVELEHVRHQIETARARMHEDAHDATRLHGLLAYEKRIQETQEWPFDQSTLVRVGAYILIPTVPWFGQAVVQYFVEHLG